MEYTQFGPDGEKMWSVEAPELDIQPDAMSVLLALDPPVFQAVVDAAAGLVNRAGDLWDASAEIPSGDPAKGFADVVVEIALQAALPLVGT